MYTPCRDRPHKLLAISSKQESSRQRICLEVYAQRRSLGEEEQGGKASLKDERTMTWCVVDYLPTKESGSREKGDGLD